MQAPGWCCHMNVAVTSSQTGRTALPRHATFTSTLLRIEGAIQVLKEIAGTDDAVSPDGADPDRRDRAMASRRCSKLPTT
jgi:hypothetical protein